MVVRVCVDLRVCCACARVCTSTRGVSQTLHSTTAAVVVSSVLRAPHNHMLRMMRDNHGHEEQYARREKLRTMLAKSMWAPHYLLITTSLSGARCLAIGDGANDVAMIKARGR